MVDVASIHAHGGGFPMKRSWLLLAALVVFLAAMNRSAAAQEEPATPDAKPAPQAQAEENPEPRLMINLESDNVKAAAAAARSLGVIFTPGGKGGPEVAEVTDALIAKLTSTKGAELRREASTALGHMQAKKSLDGLKAAIGDADVQVAVAAAEAVAEVLPSDEARTFLKDRGADESENVKAGVYSALAKIAKPEDAEFLVAGLKIDNWRVQEGAVRGLERAVHAGARLQPEDYDGVALVLGSEMLNASNAAVHFLTHIRNDESLRATLAATQVRGDGSETDGSWRTRAAALRTIRELGWPTCEEALPQIISNLGDKTSNVTNTARNILVWGRKEHYVTQQDLFPILLRELEKAEALSLRAGIMREMNDDVDKQYASRVATVAAKTLEEAKEVKAEWPARARALTLLGATGYTGNIELIAECASDDVTDVHTAAGKALEQLAPLCEAERRASVPPILQPLLEKPVDWRKTAVAARAIGHYPSEEAVESLSLLLSHSVLNVRDAASQSLALYAADDALRDSVQKAAFREVASTRGAWEYGSRVLGALESPEAIPLLIRVLKDGDWHTQVSASNAVAQIATANKIANKELSDTLIQVAQSDVLQVQDAANQALRVLAKE
jgi:HEAT repeat protein